MYQLIILVLSGSFQPSFGGIYADEHSCRENAAFYIETVKDLTPNKIYALCLKTKIEQPKHQIKKES